MMMNEKNSFIYMFFSRARNSAAGERAGGGGGSRFSEMRAKKFNKKCIQKI